MFPELELKEGWVTVVLLLALLLCVAWSIQTADWTDGLSILQGVVVVGGVLGIVLGKSRLPSLLAHLLSLLAGFTWTAFLASGVLARAMDLTGQPAVVELDRQLRAWLSIVFTGGTSPGNIVFLLLMGLLMWLVAYVSAWAIFRWQQVWLAVIICGVALIINLTSAKPNLTGFLVAFLLFALLLVVRTSVAAYEQEWRSARVGYSSELIFGFLRAGLVVSIAAILLAWVAPEAVASRPFQEVWDRVGEPWRRLQDQSSRIFRDLNYRNEPAFITFSRSMRFGGAVRLRDTPVMDVQASAGRYWRVMVFHEYTGDGWDNTDPDTVLVEENESKLASADFELRREVTQTITLRQDLGPIGTIAAAGQPLRSTLPLRAILTLTLPPMGPAEPAETAATPVPTPLRALPGDPSSLQSRLPLKAGDSYQVVSSISQADEESLMGAGTTYPEWMVPRYLQLPDSFPERVRLLAEEVAKGFESPYEKAVAIERFLRQIPYNDQISGPKPGRDGVDYFLFTAQQGYCNYYASAMVVMLRSLGVPARYVQGYGQGQKEEDAFLVLESNGHGWPEVYFPGYGWIEFEPTAGEPALVRPRSAGGSTRADVDPQSRRDRYLMDDTYEDPDAHQPGGPLPIPTPAPPWLRLRPYAGALLLLMIPALGLVALFLLRRHRWAEGLSAAERVYADLVDWTGRLLHIQPLAHQTPHEYGAAVAGCVPAGQDAVQCIVDSYVGYRFGGHAVADTQVIIAWREAQKAIWRGWLRRQGERLKSLLSKMIPRMPPSSVWERPPVPR